MKWNILTDIGQLDLIDVESATQPILIFKHSTSCSISSMSLNRLEGKWQSSDGEKIKPYYLDLLANRSVSNEIAARYSVIHESPQVLVISNGKMVYTESHSGIRLADILSVV